MTKMERTEQISKIAGIIIGLFVAGFAVYQYWDDIHQKKKNKSYDYFDRYITEEMLKAKYNVDQVISDLYTMVDIDLDKMEDIMIKRLNEGEYHESYYATLRFFDAVYQCGKIGTCNKKVIVSLFKDEAERLYRITSPVIGELNKGWITYGHSLKCITSNYEPDDCLD